MEEEDLWFSFRFHYLCVRRLLYWDRRGIEWSAASVVIQVALLPVMMRFIPPPFRFCYITTYINAHFHLISFSTSGNLFTSFLFRLKAVATKQFRFFYPFFLDCCQQPLERLVDRIIINVNPIRPILIKTIEQHFPVVICCCTCANVRKRRKRTRCLRISHREWMKRHDARGKKKKTNLKVSLETEAEHRTHARHDAT